MRILTFFSAVLVVGLAQSFQIHFPTAKESSCVEYDCKAGRECVMIEEKPECMCVVSCPDHYKPICGSDKKSYENHCQLHQHACVSGEHIKIEHKGHCKKKKPIKQWKKDRKHSMMSKKDLQDELQNDLVETLRKDERKIVHNKNRPAVCYGPQRNAIRYLLVDHWQESLKDQSWHAEGMTYRESLWGWFFTCDENKNNYLTPEELLKCSKDVAFFARPGQDNALTKELCIDAMVDDGDKNQDWRLDFEEFTRIMDPKYEPKEKKCSLEGKKFSDGEEIHLICNHCVCAVGNWVCASQECDEDKEEDKKIHKKKDFSSSVDEFDNAIDEHVLDPLHATADTWMETNLNEKKRGKTLRKEYRRQENEFLDFDTDVVAAVTEDSSKKMIDESELGMEEYYDDLYEKTKSKKKHILEEALKEVQLLKKKTQQLKKVIDAAQHLEKKEDKISKKKHSKSHLDNKREMLKNYRETNFLNGHNKNHVHPDNERVNKGLLYSLKKYEGDLFDKNSWNDLISSNDNDLF